MVPARDRTKGDPQAVPTIYCDDGKREVNKLNIGELFPGFLINPIRYMTIGD